MADRVSFLRGVKLFNDRTRTRVHKSHSFVVKILLAGVRLSLLTAFRHLFVTSNIIALNL